MSRRALLLLFLRKDLRGALSSVLGIAVGIAALGFFVALGAGVGDLLRHKVFPYDARLLEVSPQKITLGAFWGQATLDEEGVARLAALPQVRAAYKKMSVRAPSVSRYRGDFFGQQLHMGLEIIAVGADPALVGSELQGQAFADLGEGQPIPAIFSNRLLEVYNKSFAPARGLPQLTAELLRGFQFPIEFNRSFVVSSNSGTTFSSSLKFVGASDRGLLAGVLIPLDVARRINRTVGADAETYSSVVLEAADAADVPAMSEAVKQLGYKVDDAERKMSENIGAAVAMVTGALGLLSLLICALAAVNIAHALSNAVHRRLKDYAVMRAVGASSKDVQKMVLQEAFWLGLVGGVAGSALARAAAWAVDWGAHRWMPPFPFKPESFFVFSPGFQLLAVGLGVAASLLGAWAPSRLASRVDVAESLATLG